MLKWASQFWFEESGQDLVEYTLIITIFALMTMALVGGATPSVNKIWTTMHSHINEGSAVAAGS
jgi:Flp pilus assembly pilin Flp